MRCRFGIAGLSAKKSSSFSGETLPSRRNAFSPRSGIQSGSPTGATVETIERATENNGEEARIAAFGVSQPWQVRPGEQRARARKHGPACGGVRKGHWLI